LSARAPAWSWAGSSDPEQASAIGPIVGIVFATRGGCMRTLSIVSTTMREIGHATPQA
jgi:ABC-2 type transport system permease protein